MPICASWKKGHGTYTYIKLTFRMPAFPRSPSCRSFRALSGARQHPQHGGKAAERGRLRHTALPAPIDPGWAPRRAAGAGGGPGAGRRDHTAPRLRGPTARRATARPRRDSGPASAPGDGSSRRAGSTATGRGWRPRSSPRRPRPHSAPPAAGPALPAAAADACSVMPPPVFGARAPSQDPRPRTQAAPAQGFAWRSPRNLGAKENGTLKGSKTPGAVRAARPAPPGHNMAAAHTTPHPRWPPRRRGGDLPALKRAAARSNRAPSPGGPGRAGPGRAWPGRARPLVPPLFIYRLTDLFTCPPRRQ